MTEEDLVRLYQRGAMRRGTDRAACVSPEALLAAVEHTGSEAERLRSINHAMTCADCAEELELLRSTRIARDLARVPRFGFALAASIVLVAGLGYYSLARSRADDDLVRDGTGDIQLVSPITETTVRFDSLVWRSVTGATGYAVDVRREDGTLLTSGATADTTFVLPDSVRVDRGTDVYWGVTARLSDGSELRSATRRIRIATP